MNIDNFEYKSVVAEREFSHNPLKSQKFLPKSFTLLLRILECVKLGFYPSQIAKILNKRKQNVHYYIKKLRKMGLLRLKVRSSCAIYELTKEGEVFLSESKKILNGGEVSAYKGVRLHAFSLKFPIVEGPRVSVDWNRVPLCNWSRFVGCECGVTVEKTTRHVIVHAREVFASDPYEATLCAVLECLRVARVLEEKFGMKLGVPKLLRKPHYAVYDPVAAVVASGCELSDDVGKIDASEGYGEIDWYSPETAKDYLLMPARVKALESLFAEFKREVKSEFADLKAGLMTIFKTWNLVGNRLLDLLTRLGATASKINAVSPLSSDVCFNAGRATAMFATASWVGGDA